MDSFSEVAFLSIKWYSKHPEVYKMADHIVDSYVATKKRSHRKKYVIPARKLIASMWFHPSDWFRFSTKPDYYSKNRKQVFLTPEVLTLFKHMRDMRPALLTLEAQAIPPGISKTGRGMATIYRRTDFFKTTLKTLKSEDIIYAPGEERITLKNNDDVYIPVPEEIKQASWYSWTVEVLERHSAVLAKASLKLSDGSPINAADVYYIRRFKIAMNVTGRLYAPFENWKEKDRLSINFNGSSAMSIDISSLNPILLLRMGCRMDSEPEGLFKDVESPYCIPFWDHIPRAVHKHVINMLFNCKTPETMIKACNSTHWWIGEDGAVVSRTYNHKETRKGQPVFPGRSAEIKRYIQEFKKWHPQLSRFIGSGIGNKLQFVDSELILFILNAANQENIPVLPVHDEVVFPEEHRGFVLSALVGAFWYVLGEPGEFGTLKVKAKRIVGPRIEHQPIEIDLNRVNEVE